MASELEINLQKQEAMEKEIQALEERKTGLESADKGLQEAIDAKKKEIAELNAEKQRIKGESDDNFSKARQDNVDSAFARLVAATPELQNNAELQGKVRAEFTKFDERHFDPNAIYKDMRFAWISINRDSAFSDLDAFHAQPEEIRKQQLEQIGGAGIHVGSDGNASGAGLTREQEVIAKETGVDPKYIKMASGNGPKAIEGGMLKGSEKRAA